MTTKHLTESLRAVLDVVSGRPILTRKDLALRFGRTLATIDNWRKRGYLPAPVYLPGCRFPYWKPIDIANFESRHKSRRAKI